MVSSTIETTEVRELGGFDIIAATNPAVPKPNWDSEFAASSVSSNISEVRGFSMLRFQFSRDEKFSGKLLNTTIYGIPANWTNNPLGFQALDPDYPDGQAAWAAIQTNNNLAILDGLVAPQ